MSLFLLVLIFYSIVILYKKTSQNKVTLLQRPHATVKIVLLHSHFFFFYEISRSSPFFLNRIIHVFIFRYPCRT